MLNRWMKPYAKYALIWIRLAFGIGLMYHGYGKIIGGVAGFATGMVANTGFAPAIFWAWAVTLLELVGGAFLIVGLLTRLVSLALIIEFLIIIFVVKQGAGLGRIELDMLYLGMALTFFFAGARRWSLDALFSPEAPPESKSVLK
ncbi:MAG TPA: DoxX family protein [Candidatus Nanoarchaeia archaeon]|nr:DoxX family protein [Candidatus Nanoarchaeia archaeon]